MATKCPAAITGQEIKSTSESGTFWRSYEKKPSYIVVGLTVILPRIATGQNVVTDWNEIAVTTALAGNNGAIVQPTPKSGRAIVPCLPHCHRGDKVPPVSIAGGDIGNPNFTFTVSSMVTNTVHVISQRQQPEQEVENARINAGIHYHHSVVQGINLGRKVSEQGFRGFYELQSR
jgi:hypothetical protein